jgi:hypothetical protein
MMLLVGAILLPSDIEISSKLISKSGVSNLR